MISPTVPLGTAAPSGSTTRTSACGAARPAERRCPCSWSARVRMVATGDSSVMPYAWVNPALGKAFMARSRTAWVIGEAP